MQLTWYGTASVGLDAGWQRVLFDPYFCSHPARTPVTAGVFAAYRHIFITHAHFDHLSSVAAILAAGESTVYCTACARDILIWQGVAQTRIQTVGPGDQIELDGMTVRVLAGRHIRFDAGLVLSTLAGVGRIWRYRDNLCRIFAQNRMFREQGETVVYWVQAQGQSVVLLGSLALADGVEYPTGADVLVLPYQGSSRLVPPALAVTERLRPKAVWLDHFDDAFPPVSRDIDPAPFVTAMKARHPDIAVTVPRIEQRYNSE